MSTKFVGSGCWRILADLADLPMDYARYGYAFPASYIKTQRETLRRLLMAYLEGIYVFRIRPKAVYAVLDQQDIKDPVVQKDVYERALKSVREFPVPEPNGIQSVLDSLPHPNARNIKPASVMDTSIYRGNKEGRLRRQALRSGRLMRLRYVAVCYIIDLVSATHRRTEWCHARTYPYLGENQ